MQQEFKNSPVLRIFFDGLCPLCMSEIRHLSRLDLLGNLDLQDINASDFQIRYPHIGCGH